MAALALAKHHYAKKEYKVAAQRFHDAYKIHPLPGFLFNAARSEQRAFLLGAAETHYREVLTLDGVDARTRKRTEVHLGEVEETRKRLGEEAARAAEAQRKKDAAASEKERISAAKAASVKNAPASTMANKGATVGGGGAAVAAWKTPVAFGATGVGVVVLGVGAYLLKVAADDSAKVEEDLQRKDDSGKIVGISNDEYNAAKQDIEGQQTIAIATMATGALAAGVGAYLLMSRPASIGAASRSWHVTPTGRGLLVSWRF